MTRRTADRMRQPQLFGDSAAARQARRAAGDVIDGDDPRFVEHRDAKTKWVSARRITRTMARLNGVPASGLSAVPPDDAHDRDRQMTWLIVCTAVPIAIGLAVLIVLL